MKFLDNDSERTKHGNALRGLANNATGKICIATGFVSPKGLAELADISGDRPVCLLIGDRRLLGRNHNSADMKRVLDWLNSDTVKVKLLYSKEGFGNMHAKVWLFNNSGVVTSANLTGSGLGDQPEMGAIIRDPEDLSSLQKWFDRKWRAYKGESRRLHGLLERELGINPKYSGRKTLVGARRGGCMVLVAVAIAACTAFIALVSVLTNIF